MKFLNKLLLAFIIITGISVYAENNENITDDTVLVTMEGKPVITVADVKQFNIRTTQDLQKAYNSLLWPLLTQKWVKQQGLDNEYQKLLKQAQQFDALKKHPETTTNEIYEKLFFQHYPLFKVTKEEIKKFYDNNTVYKKSLSDKLLYAIDAFGIRFNTRSQQFKSLLHDLDQNTTVKTLKDLAQQHNLETKQFENITFSMPPEIGPLDAESIGSFLFPKTSVRTEGDIYGGCISQNGTMSCWIIKVTDKTKSRDALPSFEEFYNNPQFAETQKFIVHTIKQYKISEFRDDAREQLKKKFQVYDFDQKVVNYIKNKKAKSTKKKKSGSFCPNQT